MRTEYEQAAYDAVDENGGDVGGPVGWFGKATLFDGGPRLVQQNSDGVITVTEFEKAEDRDERYEELERAHALGELGIDEQTQRLIIEAYKGAAVYAEFDEAGYPWSITAQKRVIAEVLDFVIQNHDEIIEWQKRTGHTWEQVGIDFEFSRNDRAENFSTRPFAGDVGETLDATARAWGSATPVLHDGEVYLEEA